MEKTEEHYFEMNRVGWDRRAVAQKFILNPGSMM
jgi:hypothetical protein